ncbi:MAG: hypothetical protein ACM3O7_00670 [Acidobacteriota bacterium]
MLASFLIVVALSQVGEVAPGTPIVSIRIVRHDVFDTSDPGMSAWPYRAANSLHVVTREGFIRSLLLFKVGDPLDPERLAETERLLRATGFLQPVDITAHPAPGGAEVVVETHDQWTLEVSIVYGQVGNRRNSGFTLNDDNFLGLGKSVTLETRSRTERRTTALRYRDPLFLGTRWQLALGHTEASDGSSNHFQLEYPFFALDTARAGGGTWDRDTQTDTLWANAKKAVRGKATRQSFRLWGGLRVDGDGEGADRLTLGVFGERAIFTGWHRVDGSPYPTPADRDMLGLEVGWQHQTADWVVVRGFRAWQRQEDVVLGPSWGVVLGLSLPAFGGDTRRLRYSGDYTRGWLHDRQYTWVLGNITGRLDGNTVANVITHVELGTAKTGRVGWRARVAADLGHELDLDQQLTLGAETGLRGWEPDTFDGTSRAVANLEWRHQIDGELLHLGVLGVVVFADAGKSWGARVGTDTGGVRSDAGVGLLLEITRAAILRVVRVEVAYPDRGKGPTFLVTSDSLF